MPSDSLAGTRASIEAAPDHAGPCQLVDTAPTDTAPTDTAPTEAVSTEAVSTEAVSTEAATGQETALSTDPDPRPDTTAPAGAGLPLLARPRVLDGVIVLSYLLAAFGLYRELWLHLDGGYLLDSGEDQNLFEWFFAVQAHALAAGHPTLFTTLQNFPAGVNLMANTAMPGLAVPLAPLTLLTGPTVTWAVLLSGGLAGTAIAWYWLFSRYLVRSRWSAAVGGGWAGFAPPVISHAHAHPNFTAAFLLPLIVAGLVRLRRGRRVLREGVLLGALLAWQVLIGEEPLLILAVGLLVWTLAWALFRPRAPLAAARPLLAGLAVAAAVAVALVGYPLWSQFAGPGSYHGLTHPVTGNDLAAFPALPRQSIGGQLWRAGPDPALDAVNPTERNASVGWGPLVLAAFTAGWLWRLVPARLAAVTALVMWALSLGSPVVRHGVNTGIPGPWAALARLPLFDSLLEARLALAAVPALGVLLALGCDRVLLHPARGRVLTSRRVWFAALACATLPLLPVRFTAVPRAATPVFFSSGDWRAYVQPGRSVLTVPPPDPGHADPLHWQVTAGLGFPLVEGYFVGPDGPDHHGIYGAPRSSTSLLLTVAADTRGAPRIGPAERSQALADLRAWRTGLVVLPDPDAHPAARDTVVALFGPGQRRDDVLLWTRP